MEGAKWTINGVDISAEYGAYIKKGSYANLMLYPEAKEYVSEDVREEHGARMFVDLPRVKPRQFTISFYIVGGAQEIKTKYERFFYFLLTSKEFTLTLKEHNRNYQLVYLSAIQRNDLKVTKNGTNYIQIDVNVYQKNPFNVTESFNLITESNSQNIITEEGEEIIIDKSIF